MISDSFILQTDKSKELQKQPKKKLKNFRINIFIKNNGINYMKNFGDFKDVYMPLVKEIFDIAKKHEINNIWYFAEPHLELTWIGYNPEFITELGDFLHEYSKKQPIGLNCKTPTDGYFPSWYGKNYGELEFNWKCHVLESKIALLFHEYKKDISAGLGINRHYQRMCHILACQLALNFKDEAVQAFHHFIYCSLAHVLNILRVKFSKTKNKYIRYIIKKKYYAGYRGFNMETYTETFTLEIEEVVDCFSNQWDNKSESHYTDEWTEEQTNTYEIELEVDEDGVIVTSLEEIEDIIYETIEGRISEDITLKLIDDGLSIEIYDYSIKMGTVYV